MRSRIPEGLHPALAVYVSIVVIGGVGVVAWSWVSPEFWSHRLHLSALGFWLALSLAAECCWLETPTRNGMVSMSSGVNLASLFVLPLPAALSICATSILIADFFLRQRGVVRTVFNAAQTVITLAVCFGVMRLLGAPASPEGTGSFIEAPWATLSSLLVFFTVNTLLVSGAIALQRRERLWTTWRDNYGFGYQFMSSVVLYFAGLTLVTTFEVIGYVAGLLYISLFFFVRDAYHRALRSLTDPLDDEEKHPPKNLSATG
jgi:hypothetical protein